MLVLVIVLCAAGSTYGVTMMVLIAGYTHFTLMAYAHAGDASAPMKENTD